MKGDFLSQQPPVFLAAFPRVTMTTCESLQINTHDWSDKKTGVFSSLRGNKIPLIRYKNHNYKKFRVTEFKIFNQLQSHPSDNKPHRLNSNASFSLLNSYFLKRSSWSQTSDPFSTQMCSWVFLSVGLNDQIRHIWFAVWWRRSLVTVKTQFSCTDSRNRSLMGSQKLFNDGDFLLWTVAGKWWIPAWSRYERSIVFTAAADKHQSPFNETTSVEQLQAENRQHSVKYSWDIRQQEPAALNTLKSPHDVLLLGVILWDIIALLQLNLITFCLWKYTSN